MRSMGLTCIGKIRKMPVVIDEKIEIQDVMNCTHTGDHRFGDASIFMPLYKTFKGYLADPGNFNPEKYKENIHYLER
jgi:pyruvate/2-oxoglutarate dehydrogenase complex dihydrolipoamide acyltransferase (E2) component